MTSNTSRDLTNNEQKVLGLLKINPRMSLRDIVIAGDFSAVSTVAYIVKRLQDKGVIVRQGKLTRKNTIISSPIDFTRQFSPFASQYGQTNHQ